MSLLNVVCPAYAATAAQSAQWYVELFIGTDIFRVDENQLAGSMRKLTWDSEATAADRIASVATQFGGEVDFRIEVSGMTVVGQYIDLYKKRGQDVGQTLILNRDVNKITTRQSVASLCTALYAIGANEITLSGYTVPTADRDTFEIVGKELRHKKAFETWHSKIDGRYLTGYYSSEASSVADLYNETKAQLLTLCQPETTYEVDIVTLPDGTKCGNTVTIIDEQGDTYLGARIIALETSEADGTTTATLGDFTRKESGISAQIRQWAESQAIVCTVTSSNGSLFKNARIQTALKAHVFLNGRELTADEIAVYGVVNWYSLDGTLAHANATSWDFETDSTVASYILKLESEDE